MKQDKWQITDSGVVRGILVDGVDLVDVVDGVMADLGTRVPVFVICHLSFVMGLSELMA